MDTHLIYCRMFCSFVNYGYHSSFRLIYIYIYILQRLKTKLFWDINLTLHWCINPSSTHHTDLCHLPLQFGAWNILKVVVVASAPGVCLHDEVLHVQRAGVGVSLT